MLVNISIFIFIKAIWFIAQLFIVVITKKQNTCSEFLMNLLDTKKNVYVYMAYEYYEKWSTALNRFDLNSGDVLNMFKLFFEQYPVKGIIFTHLDAWASIYF